MAVNTNGILLTYEDLVTKRAFPLLKNTLELKTPLIEEFVPFGFDDDNLQRGRIIKDPIEPSVEVPNDVLERCAAGYERYLKFLETKTALIRFSI